MDDTQIEVDEIKRAQAGDEDAFAALIRRHQGLLRAGVARYISDKEQVYDIVQEVFLAAWRRLADFDPEQGMLPWLRVTARNMTMSALRKRMRHQEINDLGLVEQALAKRCGDQAFIGVIEREQNRLQALRFCLSQLSERQQQLLNQRYRDGVSVKSIGEQSGKKPNAVSMVLNRLRERLHGCMVTRLRTGGG